MYHLKNKAVEINGSTLNYFDLYAENIKVIEQGFNYEDMAKALKLIELLKSNSETISIEDADFEYLKDRLKNSKWKVADANLFEALRYIQELKKEEPKK